MTHQDEAAAATERLRRALLVQARLDRMPDAMAVRRRTAEHPFGTLKS